MKPFNLEHALAHPEDVISRDGREIAFITYDGGAGESQKLIIRFKNEDSIKVYYSNGSYWNDSQISDHDLFLKPQKRKVFVNLYANLYYVMHETKEIAERECSSRMTPIAVAVPIEIQE